VSALSRRRAGSAHQVWAVLAIAQRDLTKLLRDRTRLLVSLAFPILLIVGLGVALQPTVGRAVGLDWVTFTFVGVFAATLYQSAAAGMLSVVEDRETDFSRELFVAPVSRLTIVAGKVLGESLVALCQGLGIILFALLLQVRITPGQAAALVPAAVACCLLGAAFGLATLAVLPNQRAGLQVFPFLILPQYFLAGVVAPLHGLPWYLEALSRVMPLRYAVDLTRSAFYAGTPGYQLAVADGPVADLAVVVGLFAVLLVVGALVFDYRERSR
jgi:ABC-2 type transport system permease protein